MILYGVQAFTDAAMRLYLPTILDVARYTMAQWAASEEPVLFYQAARAFAFDIAATVLTGTQFDGDTLGPSHFVPTSPFFHTLSWALVCVGAWSADQSLH